MVIPGMAQGEDGIPQRGWRTDIGLPEIVHEDPLPGIIEFAPENPVALHLVPHHTSEEIAEWFALKSAAQRAADRRLSRTTGEVQLPKYLRPVEEDTDAPFEVKVDEETIRDLSEERRQALHECKRLESLRELPFAKGIGVQATVEEVQAADARLRQHSRDVHSTNKRSPRYSAW